MYRLLWLLGDSITGLQASSSISESSRNNCGHCVYDRPQEIVVRFLFFLFLLSCIYILREERPHNSNLVIRQELEIRKNANKGKLIISFIDGQQKGDIPAPPHPKLDAPKLRESGDQIRSLFLTTDDLPIVFVSINECVFINCVCH